MTKEDDTPIEKQHFRHWIELRDLRDDTVRALPVTIYQRIALVAKKKGVKPDTSPAIRLEVQDAGRTWEALDLEDLARQLREHYLDGAFKRTLKCERDPAAEERYRSALNGLAQILAEVVVREMLDKGPEARTP